MAGTYWGSRSIGFVASNGALTQLYPNFGSITGTMSDTSNTGTYPPTGGGIVRRPSHGHCVALEITGDGSNAVTVELWDIAGTDRGKTYTQDSTNGTNVNNDVLIPNGKITTLNGILIGTKQIPGTGGGTFTERFEAIPFNQGLAVRVVGAAGAASIAPYIDGGFMIQTVAG